MKTLLFCLFLIPICSSAQADSSSDLQADSSNKGSFAIRATIQDLYAWSKEQTKYHLKNSQFNFVVIDKTNNKVVLNDNITKQVKSPNLRSLLVQSNKVSFTSAGQKNTIPAKLSSDHETLVVYFPKSNKVDILNGLLKTVLTNSEATKGIVPIKNPQGLMTDYVCRIQPPSQLVCAMDYHFDVPIPVSTSTSHSL